MSHAGENAGKESEHWAFRPQCLCPSPRGPEDCDCFDLEVGAESLSLEDTRFHS